MIEIWKGNCVENGDYVSDRRLLFKRADVINNRLLKEIDNPDEVQVRYPQKKPNKVFASLKRKATQLLEFDSYIRYEKDKSGGMLFRDYFGGEWKIQKRYYQLAYRLLGFDYLIGNKPAGDRSCVMFVKQSEIIGALMCFS